MKYHDNSSHIQAAADIAIPAESFRSEIYSDSRGIPTVGYGYALIIRSSTDNFVVRSPSELESDFSRTGIAISSELLAQLEEIAIDLNGGNLAQAKQHTTAMSSQVGVISRDDAFGLLSAKLEDAAATVERRLKLYAGSHTGQAIFDGLQNTDELAALISVAYNAGGSGIGGGITGALESGNRNNNRGQTTFYGNNRGQTTFYWHLGPLVVPGRFPPAYIV